MSVIEFKQDLLDSILELVWKQWTLLGAAGQLEAGEAFVLDPEALLVFSAHFARYDQRLYDLITDWLRRNGESINLPRLKAVMKRFPAADKNSLGVMAASVNLKKWNLFAKTLLPKEHAEPETMFFNSDGSPNNFILHPDKTAQQYHFLREQYTPGSKVMTFPEKGTASLLLRLRGAFGMSARAEAVLTMLNKDFCRIHDVADAGGYSWKASSDVLDELSRSGIAAAADKNKRGRTYFLKNPQAIHALFGVDQICFPDWQTIFGMLSAVWESTGNPHLADVSERSAWNGIQQEFQSKVNDRLQNCGIHSLSKLTAESISGLPEILRKLNKPNSGQE